MFTLIAVYNLYFKDALDYVERFNKRSNIKLKI